MTSPEEMLEKLNTNHPPERGSGRTFRKLLKALVSASEGYDVYYVSGSDSMAEYYCHKALAVVENFMVVRSFEKRKIDIGEGSITFSTERQLNDSKAYRGYQGVRRMTINDD